MPHPRELPIPRPVANEQKALEIVRVWIAGGGQYVSLSTNVMGDPRAWGILLTNLARHAAAATQQTRGMDASETLAQIKAALDAEWANPTDKTRGEVITKSPPETPE